MGKTFGLIFPTVEHEKHTCEICGKEYKTKDNLDRHMAEKHSDKDT